MAKSRRISRKKASACASAASSSWGQEHHSARIDARISSIEKRCQKYGRSFDDVLAGGYKRSALAHDSSVQIDGKKLKLNISLLRKEIDKLRNRLTKWDDDMEKERLNAERRRQEEEEKRKLSEKEEEDDNTSTFSKTRRKKRRLGPETWKLRGAARPAWEVYDFDTRYVDPHVKAHEDAAARVKRERNILALYRGKISTVSSLIQPQCRKFLSLLMQLGTLCQEANKLRSARDAFQECVDLEGYEYEGSTIITNARAHLIRLYINSNRPDSARALFERCLPKGDSSAWMCYGAALIEYVSWKILSEPGSTEETAVARLAGAIKSNVFCAFHLAYNDLFESVVEYADEVEDAETGTLEEAIEYCASEQMGIWMGTDGALEWVRNVLLKVMNGCAGEGVMEHFLTLRDLDWDGKLNHAKKEYDSVYAKRKKEVGIEDKETYTKEEKDEEHHGENSAVDFLMYVGMFRTAMEMLEESQFRTSAQDH